jgi:hypothetical protein
MTKSGGKREKDGDAPTLSLDAILDILAHHHRRGLLVSLKDASESHMTEAEVISLFQRQGEARVGKQPSWDHLSASLHHIHEPKLSEAGLITYDENKGIYHYHPDEEVENSSI